MKIFDGKKESQNLLKIIKNTIKKEKLSPHLAVILVGNDKASEVYVNIKKKTSETIGVKFSLYKYPENANQDLLLNQIDVLNKDLSVSGIMVQMPLPSHLNIEKIILNIDPNKDADGFHFENLKAIKSGHLNVDPVLPEALFYIIKKAYGGCFDEKRVKALVNSDVFGDTLKSYFFFKGINVDILVDNSYTKGEVSNFTKDADILISVLGRPKFIKGDMIKNEAILIDAGIVKKNNRIYGDFDFNSVKEMAGFITPVPGGVGPMTVAMLLKNVVNLERKKQYTKGIK